ncbi:hypothetical protein JMJ77_0009815 [Colletotrichum scovillei]|uniref:Uncharacterized protein n=1 Tax=Colletotrichum scovillei TaxID=1209932 RepID=A0A9P7R1Z5_9PEZI|nr:hypothetical protein JMJ77_0009815 [Colletotrichum scovillei]KAG7052902.1 hypothetical protein JMJ78_0005912 [Colletotrichum scovillei]KAG7065191.1 hypothetical protein JMJ76_0012942 [Colletotrichum scovillei]
MRTFSTGTSQMNRTNAFPFRRSRSSEPDKRIQECVERSVVNAMEKSPTIKALIKSIEANTKQHSTFMLDTRNSLKELTHKQDTMNNRPETMTEKIDVLAKASQESFWNRNLA